MALWEYKVITSGPHGFASPALLEAHLNTLGKDEWEIVHFQTLGNNSLAFHGLVRRPTVRDWAPPPETAISAPSGKTPAYESTSRPTTVAAAAAASAAEEKPELPPVVADEAARREDATIRTVRNTERDLDPDAEDEEDWDEWEGNQDELPTFFEAIKPHMRRNQRGPGMAVGVDFLSKRWDQREADIVGALKECGFSIPESEDAEPEYFEFEGDLYWVNRNNRGLLFINTREKPRPIYRAAQAKKLSPDDPAMAELQAERPVATASASADGDKRRNDRPERNERGDRNDRGGRAERGERGERTDRPERSPAPAAAAAATSTPASTAASGPADDSAPARTESVGDAPEASSAPVAAEPAGKPSGPMLQGEELLLRLQPLMRRNRRGPGYSGSIGYLARALKLNEADLSAALVAMGLNTPVTANEKALYIEIGNGLYWMNKDSRGGIWINGREKPRGGGRVSGGEGDATAGSAAHVEDGASSESGAASSTSDAVTPATSVADTAESAPAPAKSPADETPTAPFSATAEEVGSSAPSAPEPAAAPASADEDVESDASSSDDRAGETAPLRDGDHVLAALRILLKPNRRGGGVMGETEFLARSVGKTEDELVARLLAVGLQVPAESDSEPVVVEHDGDTFWISKHATKGTLWLNAKAPKTKAARKPSTRAPRSRKPKAGDPAE